VLSWNMDIVLLAILTLIASGVGTLTGFGTSTIMVPVVAFFFPLPVTLIFVGIIHFFSDIWKIILFKRGVQWKVLLSFGLPGIVASLIGAKVILHAPQENLLKILGIILIAYTSFLFYKPKFRLPANVPVGIFGGALSGFVAGIFGIGGAVRGMFLSAYNLKKDVYIFTSGAIALVIDTSRLFVYWGEGTKLNERLLWGFLIFVPVSLLGAEFGKRLIDRIPQKEFRKIVGVFLFLTGVKLLLY